MKPEATYLDPIGGWRAWRIMIFLSLDKPVSWRLAASGTHGIPKFWQPRVATDAVCGRFESTHDAPWPACTCGIHAYADREEAFEQFLYFTAVNGRQAVGWAFGRVSLWGRIVEHERGWRAEHAYPYDLTVWAMPHVAASIQSMYAVDVDARPHSELPRVVIA